MDTQIISLKLLGFGIGVSIIFLIIKGINTRSNNLLQVYTCSEQNKLEVLLRYRGTNLLINPTSSKNVEYCLGKYMPFFDRTIEYVLNPTEQIESDLSRRYTVLNKKYTSDITLGVYSIQMMNNQISLRKDGTTVIIYKRPLNNIVLDKEKKFISKIIRLPFTVHMEQIFSRSYKNAVVLKEGEFYTFDF